MTIYHPGMESLMPVNDECMIVIVGLEKCKRVALVCNEGGLMHEGVERTSVAK